MRTEFTCLCCEGVDVKGNHACPLGTMDGSVLRMLCVGGKHRDFCTQCTKVLNRYFAAKLAKKKIRLE